MAGPRAPAMRERRDMVRALRAARLPIPDRLTGEVIAALAEAGVFRLRATLIRSIPFQSYLGLLGVRLPATLSTDPKSCGEGKRHDVRNDIGGCRIHKKK